MVSNICSIQVNVDPPLVIILFMFYLRKRYTALYKYDDYALEAIFAISLFSIFLWTGIRRHVIDYLFGYIHQLLKVSYMEICDFFLGFFA